ncbi:MAG TPA: peptide ABC transporter substrate-binding protein [Candidatus Saccharimonadales bacterium]|nr:peptide ABC transporter substrate-binding protein [Candidatus Saccharimonadales bacterium]
MLRAPLNQLQEMTPSKRTIKGHLRRVERVTLRHAHRFIVQRAANLRDVSRKATAWIILILMFIGVTVWQQTVTAKTYTADIPSSGGVYSEGVFGTLDNLNPILASSAAERSGSRLLFAQLVTYNEQGNLVGELARTWHSTDDGKTYIVTLRDDALWQDGTPITADDVLFTFNLIKNADTRSPLYSSWRNIVVEKVDDKNIRFILPNPLASFENSLTVGILPMQALKDLLPSELRTADFNLRPTMASGPFVFQDSNVIEPGVHELLRLKANPNYFLGKPSLDGFNLHAYQDRDVMTTAFRTHEVASISDANAEQIKALQGVDFVETNSPLYHGTFAFLKNDSTILSDIRVRRALQAATDQQKILDLLQGRPQSLSGPLLPGQLGYRADYGQPGYDLARANQLLDEAGWVKGPDGIRSKDGRPLVLRIVTTSSGDFPAIAQAIMNQWQELGITFDSQIVRSEDIQENVIAPRSYDVLIYEIAIGRDPDVFAFWDTSQATERGFNLSDYKSGRADEALQSARIRLDAALRAAKYQSFVSIWTTDAAAVALFRPTLTYVQSENAVTFLPHPMVDQTDRYYNVRYWAPTRVPGNPTR